MIFEEMTYQGYYSAARYDNFHRQSSMEKLWKMEEMLNYKQNVRGTSIGVLDHLHFLI